MFVHKTKKLLVRSASVKSYEPVHEISNNVDVPPAKPQISLCIRAVLSEPLLVAWVFYDC